MSSFAVSDCLYVTRHAGYQRFAVLLGDFSDPNFLDCSRQVLSAWRLLECHLVLHDSPQVFDSIEIRAVPEPFQYRYVFFSSSGTQWLPLNGDKTWIWTCSFNFSLSNSTHMALFIVVLGRIKHRPPASQHDMTPKIIWLGVCFIVATAYFLSKR